MVKKVVSSSANELSPETSLPTLDTDAEAKAETADLEPYTTDVDVVEEVGLLEVEDELLPLLTDNDTLSVDENNPLTIGVEDIPDSNGLILDVVIRPTLEETSQSPEETSKTHDLKALFQRIAELEIKMNELEIELNAIVHKKTKKGTKLKKLKGKGQDKKVDQLKGKKKHEKSEKVKENA